MAFGYVGKILRVDLQSQTTRDERLPEEVSRKYIGGSGLASKIIYDEVKPETKPLDPENRLLFITGPLTGTIVPTSGRWCVCTKSPLTGIWAESHIGGFWGPELKYAGYDGVIVQGKSDTPAYIWIHDGQVEIKSAKNLWGLSTTATQQTIKKELQDEETKVACIGQAGENLVLLASIISDYPLNRAAGRCGTGAVMGSKNLKAIAVRANETKKIASADEKRLAEFLKKIYITIRSNPTVQILASHGTNGQMDMFHEYGDTPVYNWRRGSWPEGVEKICGQAVTKKMLLKQTACSRCIIACGRHVEIKDGLYAGTICRGPEYETAGALGTMLLNDDIGVLTKAGQLCDEYGMDTISTGATIAFAMECYEKKLIGASETDGVGLIWGNGEAILATIKKMAKKDGWLGKLLSEGVRNAAEAVGKRSEDYAIHVKGLELPMHDPRAFQGMGLQYATSPRGACHNRGFVASIEQGARIPELDIGMQERLQRFTTEGKGLVVAKMQNWHEIQDSLIICKFAYLPPMFLASIYTMVTGSKVTFADLIEAADRTFTLKRAFNIRAGVSRKDDTLPKRILEEPTPDGGAAGKVNRLSEMLDDHYKARGWNHEGIPTREKLESLGLDDVAEDLWHQN
jgi:aldehyde:ferredoxin oxidoreductase